MRQDGVPETGGEVISRVQVHVVRAGAKGRSMKRIRHKLRRAAISLEMILILGVIALPVLVFLVKFGWPSIKGYFVRGASEVGIDVPQG